MKTTTKALKTGSISGTGNQSGIKVNLNQKLR
jgi:hypothetical protein